MITNADHIAEATQIKQKAAEKLAGFAGQAEGRLRVLLSGATYEEVAGKAPGNSDYQALLRAESLLSLYFGFVFLNLRPTDLGGFSKMIGYGGETSEALMSARELNSYRQGIYGMAVELIEHLRPDIDEETITSYDAGGVVIA